MSLSTISVGPAAMLGRDWIECFNIMSKYRSLYYDIQSEQIKMGFNAASKGFNFLKDLGETLKSQATIQGSGEIGAGVASIVPSSVGLGAQMHATAEVSANDKIIANIDQFKEHVTMIPLRDPAAQVRADNQPIANQGKSSAADQLLQQRPEKVAELFQEKPKVGGIDQPVNIEGLAREFAHSPVNKQTALDKATEARDWAKSKRDSAQTHAQELASRFQMFGQTLKGMVEGSFHCSAADKSLQAKLDEGSSDIQRVNGQMAKDVKDTTQSGGIDVANRAISSLIEMDRIATEATFRA